jgi:MFS family permease
VSKEIGSSHVQEIFRGRGSPGINNVGLMARALALKDNADAGEEENVRWQTLQVSTLSIASCVGRILIGIFPSMCSFDKVKTFCWIGVTADFANHRGTRRARCLSIVAASFVVSQLVGLGVQDIKHLQYAVILVGISYGGVFGLLPTIIIEWFGMGPYTVTHFRLNCENSRPLPRRMVKQTTSQRTGALFPYPRS